MASPLDENLFGKQVDELSAMVTRLARRIDIADKSKVEELETFKMMADIVNAMLPQVDSLTGVCNRLLAIRAANMVRPKPMYETKTAALKGPMDMPSADDAVAFLEKFEQAYPEVLKLRGFTNIRDTKIPGSGDAVIKPSNPNTGMQAHIAKLREEVASRRTNAATAAKAKEDAKEDVEVELNVAGMPAPPQAITPVVHTNPVAETIESATRSEQEIFATNEKLFSKQSDLAAIPEAEDGTAKL